MDSETLAISTVSTVTDEFDAMSDRELLLHVARKIQAFEHLGAQLAEAAESNPMARMFLGKIVGKGGGLFG